MQDLQAFTYSSNAEESAIDIQSILRAVSSVKIPTARLKAIRIGASLHRYLRFFGEQFQTHAPDQFIPFVGVELVIAPTMSPWSARPVFGLTIIDS